MKLNAEMYVSFLQVGKRIVRRVVLFVALEVGSHLERHSYEKFSTRGKY